MPLYVQTTGTQMVAFGTSPTPIPGLTLTIPEGAGEQALVTLNVPNPYSYTESRAYVAGGWFGLSVDGTTLPNVASFTFALPSLGNLDNLGPDSGDADGRRPAGGQAANGRGAVAIVRDVASPRHPGLAERDPLSAAMRRA